MTQIHPTALIDRGAELGNDIQIGPYAVIENGVVVGDGCSIGAHAVIKRYARMGRANRVCEHVVIGGDPQDFKFKPCASFVEIGDNNVIREGVTIHRGSTEGAATRLGNSNFLMAYAHVAHDCSLGDHLVMANGATLGGFATIGDRVFISGGVMIHQFCRVGKLAMMGGCSKVVQDCLPFVITDGNPARARGLNVVGLKRAGIPSAEIQDLKHAFRVLLRSGAALEEALAQLAAFHSPSVAELVRFIQTSERGFTHAR